MSEVSLKEHFERLLKEQDRRIEQAQESSKVAILKAEKAIGERLKLLNEFRSQASDEAAKYATREMQELLSGRLNALEASRDRIYGGLLLVALLGVANLVKLFWGG